MDIQSQLTRGIAAYLTASGVAGNIYSEPTTQTRAIPLTSIRAGDPAASLTMPGNDEFHDIRVTTEDAAYLAPGQDPAAPQVAACNHWTQVYNALFSSDDGSTYDYVARAITAAGRALATTGTAQQKADNADMPFFTVLFWEPLSKGTMEQVPGAEGASFWQREMGFHCIACSAAL